jgi:hypothetical protein
MKEENMSAVILKAVTCGIQIFSHPVDTAVLTGAGVDHEGDQITVAGARQIGDRNPGSLIFEGKPIGYLRITSLHARAYALQFSSTQSG